MQLIIKVDLDTAKQSLSEIFRLIGNCRWADEGNGQVELGAMGPVRDDRSNVIGEWIVDEADECPHAVESAYREAAIAKYVRPGQIEIDRFAPVSVAKDGAYVQGWLFVPQTRAQLSNAVSAPPAKPPQSVSPIHPMERKAGFR